MSRAGWCRECGEWVWVDDDGACQHGHGSECVEGIHDGEPTTAGFGEGEMPAELRRFNWGAFALPLFWAFAYGAWPIASWWLISLMLPFVLASAFGVDGTSATLSGLIGVSAASEVVNGLVRLWAGLNGNRLVWLRENRRLEVFASAKPRFTVERFSGRQRAWSIVGGIALGVAAMGTSFVNAQAWSEYGLKTAGAVEPFLWLTAEVILGFWLASKVRQERVATQEASSE